MVRIQLRCGGVDKPKIRGCAGRLDLHIHAAGQMVHHTTNGGINGILKLKGGNSLPASSFEVIGGEGVVIDDATFKATAGNKFLGATSRKK